MTPTPIPTVIIDPWYSGPLTAQTLQALTVATPTPNWLWVGVLIGLMLGIVLVMSADLLWLKRK